MYNRFHNYVARNLAAINEGGRFTPPRHLHLEAAQSWKDEQLFQVARLSVMPPVYLLVFVIGLTN